MVESGRSASVTVLQTGGVSYAGFKPPVAFQFFSGPGTIVFMCSKASNLSETEGRSGDGTGLRFNINRSRLAGAGAMAVILDLGLEVELGLPLGLNVAAWGLGLNSLLLGFNRPACALVTPLDRREKLGSEGLEGPVGGSLAS